MSRRALPFSQAAVTRAVKGVAAAGPRVAEVRIDERGRIVVVCVKDEITIGPANDGGVDLVAAMEAYENGPKKRHPRAS